MIGICPAKIYIYIYTCIAHSARPRRTEQGRSPIKGISVGDILIIRKWPNTISYNNIDIIIGADL